MCIVYFGVYQLCYNFEIDHYTDYFKSVGNDMKNSKCITHGLMKTIKCGDNWQNL